MVYYKVENLKANELNQWRRVIDDASKRSLLAHNRGYDFLQAEVLAIRLGNSDYEFYINEVVLSILRASNIDPKITYKLESLPGVYDVEHSLSVPIYQ